MPATLPDQQLRSTYAAAHLDWAGFYLAWGRLEGITGSGLPRKRQQLGGGAWGNR